MEEPDKILTDQPHDVIARTGGIGDNTGFANPDEEFGINAVYDDPTQRGVKNRVKAEFSGETLRKNRDIYFERVEIDSYPRPNPDRKLMNVTQAAEYIKWIMDAPINININELHMDPIQ